MWHILIISAKELILDIICLVFKKKKRHYAPLLAVKQDEFCCLFFKKAESVKSSHLLR